MLSAIWNGETPGEEKKQELAQYCRHSSDMVEEAVRVFERVSLNRAWYQRLVENREVIAEQLDAMAYIMQDCAGRRKFWMWGNAMFSQKFSTVRRSRGLWWRNCT